eukprot:TRINITY_DN19088_c0_g1_i1.p1 TRINITY_DN19088_c0_g1~~TRINITY_DN19088_c0_g1_i1.p1  ORF type:complete len:577 (+),score=114.53 TRINITY_DN19088_c0_g1_i1:370-2100(+)
MTRRKPTGSGAITGGWASPKSDGGGDAETSRSPDDGGAPAAVDLSGVKRWSKLLRCGNGRELTAASGEGLNLEDRDVEDTVGFLDSVHGFPRWRQELKLQPSAPLTLLELNLGGNSIGDAGVVALVGALLQHSVHLRCLRLQHNRIAQRGALAVARLLEEGPRELSEVHLSHNAVGAAAVHRLLLSAATRTEYPPGPSPPLWIRLEHQQEPWVETSPGDATTLRKTLDRIIAVRRERDLYPAQPAGPLICLVTKKVDCCGPNRCFHAHEHGPLIHLPYFHKQDAPGLKAYVQGGLSSAVAGLALSSPVPAVPSLLTSAAAPRAPESARVPAVKVLARPTPAAAPEPRRRSPETSAAPKATTSAPSRPAATTAAAKAKAPPAAASAGSCDGGSASRADTGARETMASPWTCSVCTLINEKVHGLTCEACGSLRHQVSASASAPLSAASARRAGSDEVRSCQDPCWRWLAGYCKFGAECPFAHDDSDDDDGALAAASPAPRKAAPALSAAQAWLGAEESDSEEDRDEDDGEARLNRHAPAFVPSDAVGAESSDDSEVILLSSAGQRSSGAAGAERYSW